ncbi:MAG: TolC family outer membrane protein [Betaproteobacteria bacterium]|nr:TolC family outer membrane protein [Betaproteobacteria bacterium]
MPRTLLTAFALAAGALLAAPAAVGANLGEVYNLARSNDAKLAAAREAYRASRERLPQGRAGLLPNLSLSASYFDSRSDASPGVVTNTEPYGYRLLLVQPLYRKQNLETFEQAKIQVLLGEQQLRLAEQDVLLRTASAYFDVLQAEDNLATAQAQKAAFAEQLAQARKSFEVGAATITDTHEAQARFDLTTAQEIAALNDLEIKRRALEKIIGSEAPRLARLAEGAAMPLPEPSNMESWVKQAEEDSLGVATFRSSFELARREVARQRGGYLPTVDLQASYADNRNTSTNLAGTDIDTRSSQIGVVLGWNLFEGGATDSRVREAVANQERARYDLDDARRQSRLDARQGFLGVMSGDAQTRALGQALVSSEAQLKSTKLGLEVGVRTRVDLLNAQQQYFSTQRDLAAARYGTLLAGLRLKAAAGILGENDLKSLDALLRE